MSFLINAVRENVTTPIYNVVSVNVTTPIYNVVNDNVFTPVYNVGSMVHDDVTDLCMSIDKGIQVVTESILPKPLAIIAHNALRSLPITYACFYVPLEWRVGLWAAYAIIHYTTPHLLTCTSSLYFHKSLAVAFAIEVVRNLYLVMAGQFLLNSTKELAVLTVSTLAAIPMSAYYFHRSRDFIPGMRQEEIALPAIS